MNDKTKTARPLPTAEEVRAVLDYDPATGVFRWLKANSSKVRVGDVAGSQNLGGYVSIGVDCRRYYAHRLAWLYVRAVWPATGLDHIDGDPSNNALANLRETTPAANMQNRRKQTTSAGRPTSSQYLGVSWDKEKGRWVAYIGHGGKLQKLGRFKTEEEAHSAYLAAKAQLHPSQPVPRASAYDR